jgi:aminopeptidase N
LTDSRIELPLTQENKNKWLLGNLNFMGYYRVNYDEQNWLKIIKQLKTDYSVFSPTERAALIHDSFTFARQDILLYSICK